MTQRDHQPADQDASLRRAVLLAAILSIVATLVAGAALAVVLVRGSDQPAQADTTACRTVTWYAVPSTSGLPSGWTIASTRFLVDVLTTTLVGPAPSGATQGPTAFVSISCYGADAELAFARDHDSAVGAGSTNVSVTQLGDETAAVTSPLLGSNTIFVRRGSLVADITAPTTLDLAVLQSVAGAVDTAMSRALSASPRPSSTPAGARARRSLRPPPHRSSRAPSRASVQARARLP